MTSEKLTIKVAIPGRFSGEFIGRQGATRQHLQTSRDIKFWVDGDVKDEVRVLRIYGEKEQATEFKEYVFKVVRRMVQLEKSLQASSPNSAEVDMALLDEINGTSAPENKPTKRKQPPTPTTSPPRRHRRRDSSPATRPISRFQLVYLSPLQSGSPVPVYQRAGMSLYLVEDLLPHIGLKTSQEMWNVLDDITKPNRFLFVNGQEVFRASGLERFANVKGPLAAVPVDIVASRWSHLKCEL